MEVQFGELAQEQAKDEQVVQFGQCMVQDHGQANEKLKAIAEQKGIELPQELPEDAQQKYEELQQVFGRRVRPSVHGRDGEGSRGRY
jgi:putative membrane protein